MDGSVEKTQYPHIYDCIGIGFGPANIALAIALEERGLLENCLFLESRDQISWHPGMMIEGTDVQHNPLRDLVTPRNPKSPYGFLNYLKEQDRLFDYLNLDAPFPPRSDYARYVAWVGNQFINHVSLSTKVVSVETMRQTDGSTIARIRCGNGEEYLARTVSFATGRSANIPAEFAVIDSSMLIRLEDYLPSMTALMARKENARVGVIGGSQSAVEIILDISAKNPAARIHSICRGFGMKQKDLSPFTEVIYYPSFVDYFHKSPEIVQHRISSELRRSNYGAADHDVISALNFKLYEQKVNGRDAIQLHFNKDIRLVEQISSDSIGLHIQDRSTGTDEFLELDAVILATGFKNFGTGDGAEKLHPVLEGISKAIKYRDDSGPLVTRDYRVVSSDDTRPLPPMYLNGLCESTYGFGDAGSFSLLSIRSDTIAASISQSLTHRAFEMEVSDGA